MIKAIIFDFDGVIGDTYELHFRLSKFFDDTISEQDFKDHHNGNVFEKPKINFKKEDIPLFFQKQKEQFTKKHLFPLKKMLNELSKDFQLFIISSTIDENVKGFLKLGDYDKFFEKVLGATTHKSKIEKFRMIFKDYDIRSDECIFVTDTIGDIIEAREAGVRSIAVSWGYHDAKTLIKEKPFAVVYSEQELLTKIRDIS